MSNKNLSQLTIIHLWIS